MGVGGGGVDVVVVRGGGAIMTRLTLMGCRVHLQCISWCQSEAIHVKMKRIEPIKMTSSQPLTYLPFCKLM